MKTFAKYYFGANLAVGCMFGINKFNDEKKKINFSDSPFPRIEQMEFCIKTISSEVGWSVVALPFELYVLISNQKKRKR
jgi:hypothetical protein